MLKVKLWPDFNTPDAGDGGVRRVVEAQLAYCPKYGIEFVDDPDAADVLACHIQIPPEFQRRFARRPIVSHVHGFYWDEYRMADGSPAWERWSLQSNLDVMTATVIADIVTSPSEWVSQAIRRNACRDVRTVYHGVDLDLWTPTEKDSAAGRYVLWNKSRPDPVCDPTPVYEAALLLPDVDFITTFGVDGRATPENMKITGRVPYETAKKYVEEADIYLATTRETFGIGTLEAMAAGVPVVGWKWGGQREFIEHEVDGWLAKPHDIEGLTKGIRWARANREKVAEVARRKAEQFSWEGPAEQYAEIWREAAQKREGFWPGADYKKPQVTVIVTAYNLDKYLDFALASVLKQDDEFTDWECIIVDDASPDRCGEIADAWAARDPRFKVIHNEKNLYLAGARNVAVQQALGEYVLPLDADDMLGPGALKVLSEALDKDRLTWVAYGGVHFVNEDGSATDYGHPEGPGKSGWPVDFNVDTQLRAPQQQGQRPNNLLPYSSMIRREALILMGGWRERLKTAEDADLWCRLSSYGFAPRRVTLASTLIYRNRPDSMSRQNEPADWTLGFPWSRFEGMMPAGAMTGRGANAQPVSSYDPPIIAVVIPVGPGHERLLMDAIDSVSAQTFAQWECIVVNDTGHELPPLPTWVRIVEPHTDEGRADKRPMYSFDSGMTWERQRFGSPSAARNAGIRAAVARTYLPLDADDTLAPNALGIMFTAMLDALNEGTKTVVYSDFWEDPKQEGVFSVYALPDFDAMRLADHMLGCVTQLTPVEAWEQVGGYDETIPAWEDWDFQIKLCEAGYCMAHVAQPLWTYRKHTGFRRDTQYANRDEPGGAKDIILARYPDMWPDVAKARGLPTTGRSPLMGCRSCGGGSARPSAQQQDGPTPLDRAAPGAMLVQYIGGGAGSIEYRAETEAIYRFAAGEEPVYVHPLDLEFFRLREEFRIIEGTQKPGDAPVAYTPQQMMNPDGVDDPQPATVDDETPEQVDQNTAMLEEKKARVRKKAGALPAGVTQE